MNRSYNNNSFSAVVAILIVAMSMILCWKLVIPAYKDDQAQYNQESKQVEAANSKLSSLKDVKTELAENSSLVKAIDAAIPEGKDVPNLITELEAIVGTQKLTVPTIGISSPVAASSMVDPSMLGANDASVINVSFSIAGTYDQLNEVVRLLENDLRFMNITSLNYTKAKNGDMTLAIQLNVYQRANSSSGSSSNLNAGN